MDNITLCVNAENAGARIDAYIAGNTDMSRSRVQQLLNEECVKADNQIITKSSTRIQEGQFIQIEIPEPSAYTAEAEAIKLDVVYEDSDLIVINKPVDMVVHPAPGHYEGTLVNALLHHCNDLSGINGVLRPGIVHRLDKDTSGLLLVAKNDFAHASLSAQLKQRVVSRSYIAIVHGHLENKSGVIKTLLGRHRYDRKRMAVLQQRGRIAITHYRVLEEYAKHSLLLLHLETGRTHQIRVHLAHLGHPVVGDQLYGNSKQKDIFDDGQWLHAARIKFIHPRTEHEMLLQCLPSSKRLAMLQELRHEVSIDSDIISLLNF